MESYASRTLFVCALSLRALLLVVGQGPPDTGVCNAGNVFICYQEYSSVLFRPQLIPGPDGAYNETAYSEACSAFTPVSPCQNGIGNCPKEFKDQFVRSEEGYQAIRDIACNSESLQALVRISVCLPKDRMDKCVDSPSKPAPGTNPREYFCKFSQGSLRCVDDVSKECKHPYEQEKAIFKRYFSAVSNVFLCDAIANGAGTITASQAFIFGALGLILTGRATAKS
ncbi:uncharacterized protein LOC144107735 [Amblyomma americanum]